MVHRTTLSAVKYEHRNDGQRLGNTQISSFLVRKEEAQGGKKK